MAEAPSGRLAQLVAAARQEVASRRTELPPEQLRDRLAGRPPVRPFRAALSRPGLSLVAEFKRASPSAGPIREDASVREIVAAYERGGAAALSVLTEPRQFAGSLEDLRQARAASALPILRKDFIVDRYQLLEAAEAGADAVLLIVAALDDEELADLHGEARALGLACLVEVHDGDELERALRVGPELIGINNRNLRSFEVDLGTARTLRSAVPEGVTVVAESGYERPAQLEELQRIGIDAVLIGETLMRAPEPEALVRELTAEPSR